MLLQYFEPTGLVTQLPDAYNYKPYWCGRNHLLLPPSHLSPLL